MCTSDKKAILVVSFGTSYKQTREKTIGAIEVEIAAAFPEYTLRRAFTSGMIIKKVKEREGVAIDNVTQAMEHLLAEGYTTVIVQPTHIMNGEEYDKMRALTAPYEDKFKTVKYGKPLLTDNSDYEQVIRAVAGETPQLDDKTCAVVFMGHGTDHFANAAYAALDYRFKALGYKNAIVGTVEGYPEFDKIKADIAQYGAEKVCLIPLLIVAGEHVINDMAGEDEDSWKSMLEADGYSVECVIKGLGEYSAIRSMYVEHCRAVVETIG